jgi:hypothetical protein
MKKASFIICALALFVLASCHDETQTKPQPLTPAEKARKKINDSLQLVQDSLHKHDPTGHGAGRIPQESTGGAPMKEFDGGLYMDMPTQQ